MSNTCGNCDCADKTSCTYIETVVMDVPAAEHDGKCKCGTNCTCTDCTCGH
uniref:Type 3 metallothionein MT3 n=1 Tax=Glycine max TaxID=3847 RepID=I1KDW5_SOYBN